MFTLSSDLRFVNEADQQEAASYGKGLKFKKRKYLVHHYTAGHSYESTLQRFLDPKIRVSAHFLVGRYGGVTQLVPLDAPAWHAGSDSSYKPDGQIFADNQINFYGIGIEFDNYGPLTFTPPGTHRTWFGHPVNPSEVVEVDPNLRGSFQRRFWHRYTDEQLEIATDLSMALVRGLGLIRVLGHSDICPGRKQDPGPAFPTDHIRSLVFNRD